MFIGTNTKNTLYNEYKKYNQYNLTIYFFLVSLKKLNNNSTYLRHEKKQQ